MAQSKRKRKKNDPANHHRRDNHHSVDNAAVVVEGNKGPDRVRENGNNNAVVRVDAARMLVAVTGKAEAVDKTVKQRNKLALNKLHNLLAKRVSSLNQLKHHSHLRKLKQILARKEMLDAAGAVDDADVAKANKKEIEPRIVMIKDDSQKQNQQLLIPNQAIVKPV